MKRKIAFFSIFLIAANIFALGVPELNERVCDYGGILNVGQKVEITVEKQDVETGNVLADAVFGIYNATDIVNKDGKIIVAAVTLLQEITTGVEGIATCTLDLPLGTYYVKELQAPAGFVSSDEVLTFDGTLIILQFKLVIYE